MNWKKASAAIGFAIIPGGLLMAGAYYLMTHCHHRFTTPITIKDKDHKRHTYVVCVKCGEEYEYDLATMKRGNQLDRHRNYPTSR